MPRETRPGGRTGQGRGGPLREGAGTWEIRIAVCLLAVALLLLTPWVHGDGIESAALLRSVIIDRDLSLGDEYAYLSTHIVSDAGGLPGALLEKSDYTPGLDPMLHKGARDAVTGRVAIFTGVGAPIVWSPAYLIAYVASRLGSAAGLPARTDGYGGLYYLAIALTSLCCGIAGLVLMFGLARSVLRERDAFWGVLGVGLATPLLYYLYMAPAYPHAITALTTGAFFYYWWKNRGAAEPGIWFKWGLLTGFLFLVRWNDVVVAVPAIALETVRYLRRGRAASGRPPVGGALARLGLALAGFVIVASIQLAAWQYFHGRPWVRYPGGLMGFWYEGLWGAFTSPRHGLFVWHPIAVLAVIGIFLLLRRNRELAGVSIATLALLVISNCTIHDWWCGASFGMRRLISASPVFVLGLSSFFEEIGGPAARGLRARAAAPAIVLAFTAWNALLLLQYSLGMISHTGPVGFATIAANQPKAVARAIRLIWGIIG